jgi:TrmH family RNA methyltransferase
LHQTKGRRSQQQFLVEGTHLVQEAVAVGYPLAILCATPSWQERYPQLWAQAIAAVPRAETVSPDCLAALATTVNPDGVVAIAPYPTHSFGADVAPPSQPSLGIAVETLQDPGNLGSLLRSATAAGCDGLWLTADSVDPAHPKVLRASAGQWFRLPQVVCPDLVAQMHQWQQQGCQVFATGSTGAVPYWSVDLTRPTVLVVGNEGAGLGPAVLAAATQTVAIPMATAVESLNVGVAAAVILFEAQRQRQTGQS